LRRQQQQRRRKSSGGDGGGSRGGGDGTARGKEKQGIPKKKQTKKEKKKKLTHGNVELVKLTKTSNKGEGMHVTDDNGELDGNNNHTTNINEDDDDDDDDADDVNALKNQNEFIAYRIIYYVFLSQNKKYEGGSSDIFKVCILCTNRMQLFPSILLA
jgi:hypothetical protein